MREVRLDEETGTATVIVSDFQLSLAIGKEGQNARLAARLTGWRIDIKSETQLAEEEAGYGGEDWAEGEWVEDEKGELVWKPAEGGEAMSASEWTHQAEDPSEEVVAVTESADGAVTVEDVVVTEAPDGEVILDDVAVTESAEGEVTVEEVVVVAKDGVVEEAPRSPRCPKRRRHNADTDLRRLPESPAGRPADPNRPASGRGPVGGQARCGSRGLAVPGLPRLPGRFGAPARLRTGLQDDRRGRRPGAVADTPGQGVGAHCT